MPPDREDRLGAQGARSETWQIDRRTFLRLAGATGVAACGGLGFLALRGGSDPVLAEPPTDGGAIGRLANSLEYDIERIFRFVADEVRYEPYVGSLRGARGTLMARAGNSVDQALLLAALLDASLVEHRFVMGALDGATAVSLLASSAVDATTARNEALAVLAGHPGEAEGTPPASGGGDVDAFKARVDAAQDPVAAAAAAQLASGIGTITGALSAAGIAIPAGTSALPDLESRQHTWLQVATGAEWVDHDPSVPGATRGTSYATAGVPMTQIPDTLRHQVEITSIVETVSSGTLLQGATFGGAFFVDDLAGKPIIFSNTKPEGLQALGVGIADTLAGTIQYVPTLVVGDSTVGNRQPMTFDDGGGLTGVFGTPGSHEGEATAQWLNVRVVPPIGAPAEAKRLIFDRVGDVARASGSFDPSTLPPVVLTDLDADTPREYLPALTVHSFAISGGPVSGDYFVQDATDDDDVRNLGMTTNAYGYVREAVAADLGVGAGVRVFCDGPTVVSVSLAPSAPTNGAVSLGSAIDVWHRSFGTVAVPGTPVSADPAILAGVISHVAERMALGEGLPPLDPANPPPPPLSVGRIFEEATRQGVATKVYRGSSSAVSLPYETGPNALIGAAMDAGLIVIVPERAVDTGGGTHVGWWLVDPATGATTDQLEDGRGVALGEDIQVQTAILSQAVKRMLFRLFTCVAARAAAVAVIFEALSNTPQVPFPLSYFLAMGSAMASSIGNYAVFGGCV